MERERDEARAALERKEAERCEALVDWHEERAAHEQTRKELEEWKKPFGPQSPAEVAVFVEEGQRVERELAEHERSLRKQAEAAHEQTRRAMVMMARDLAPRVGLRVLSFLPAAVGELAQTVREYPDGECDRCGATAPLEREDTNNQSYMCCAWGCGSPIGGHQ